ncbi:5-formyltetrahydrofolate cyclo-ligase [Shewanella sp. 4_MG-2023]|uniref:5-formyltetrahydrofolate cyclo-ligase n=1 Tax=Shewanella sp. 4_MG-2023 TaxID=3062652 RepID=UPI0026E457BE|nr:5-formyltetrahydrofolate cyclo-ligase [Shewanella sp. 4_MG-2023]MDO6680171.1 5-formyltetrahydrofolate cyclo-ligase [Shewanella sp. 4_MG-2023]
MSMTRLMTNAISVEPSPARTPTINITYFSSINKSANTITQSNKHHIGAHQTLSIVADDNQHLDIDNLSHQDQGFELSDQERYALFDSQGMNRDFIRRHIRQERKSYTQAEQHQLSLIACRHMLAEIQQKNAQAVALYISHDGELATQKLIEALWHIGVKTYLPRIHPFSKGNLLFLHYHAESKMVFNQYGIAEPALSVQDIIPVNKLDMIVTPLVAFDDKGNRMGMGGGYYDRTLCQVIDGKPLAVGFAHDCQQVSQLPVEYWDVPLPIIITPTRRISCI